MIIDLRYGDTIEQMKLIPDKSIDFICCDLPFGTTQNRWDIVIPFNQLWKQYKRIIKDKGTIILFGNQPFTTDLICSNRSWFKYEIIWDKGRASGHLNAKIMPLRKHDNLIVFCNSKTTYNPQFTEGESYTRTNKSETCRGNYGKHKDSTIENDGYRYPTSILYYPIGRQQNKIHPTEKPIGLIEILIKQYSNEGETVLDNTFGSCTTGIACINTNRNFIGIENNMDYFNISLKRVEEKRKEKDFNVITSLGDGM